MVYGNPNAELFIDAMAIQNEGTSAATKCTVSVDGPFIIIDGCNTVSPLYRALSVPETKLAEFANGVVLDEVAHNEPPHLDLHCLLSSL